MAAGGGGSAAAVIATPPLEPSLLTASTRWAVRAVLAALVVAAFANSLGAGLIFDNRAIVLEDPRLRAFTLEHLSQIFTRNYWWPYTETALYRPLTTLTYLFNYSVLGNGDHAAGYHVVNLLIHGANVLLLFAIAERLLLRLWPAFAVAAIWSVHPILTEAVTNVVGRADLLAALGVLAALWCHIRAGDTSNESGRRWWRVGVAAAATVAIFSKESGIAVVAILPLSDLWLRPRGRITAGTVLGWIVTAIPLVIFLVMRTRAIAPVVTPIPFVDNPMVGADGWSARLTAVAVAGRYLRLMIWPLTLSADYSFPQIPIASGTAVDWLAWTAIALFAALSVAALRWNRALAFTIASSFLVFLPGSNLLFATGTIMAERLMYLPSLAVIASLVAAAVLLASRIRSAQMPLAAACTVLVVGLAGVTVARNRVWHDEVSLWTDGVKASPRSFKTHGALAEAIYQADPDRVRLPEVIAHKEQSLALLAELPDPALVLEPYREAATYYLERGDWLERHDAANMAERRAAYENASKWAKVYVSVLESARTGATPPSTKQVTDANLLVSTAAIKLNDSASAADAARRGRLANPFQPAAYQAEAAAMVDNGRADAAAVTLLTGFMVTGDTALRTAVISLYRGGLDRSGCAVRIESGNPVLDQSCEIVKRHICAASAEAIAVYAGAQRDNLAATTRETARRQFGCEGI